MPRTPTDSFDQWFVMIHFLFWVIGVGVFFYFAEGLPSWVVVTVTLALLLLSPDLKSVFKALQGLLRRGRDNDGD